MLSLAARAIEQRLNADHSDATGPYAACPQCRGQARLAGRRTKTFVIVLGSLCLDRVYYHCPVCEQGLCPRDQALGLSQTTLTPAVTRMVGAVGATVSFE